MNSEEKARLLAGMFQGANLEHAQIIAVAESGSTIIYNANKQEEHKHFPQNSTKEEGIRIFNALSDESFIEGPEDSWLFLMGFVEQKPSKIKQIKWLCNKEQLRVMLHLLFERHVNEKAYSWADIERLTPCCFIDKKGNPMELAKAKEEPSQKTDRLREIIRPVSDL